MGSYQALARRYRPRAFDALVGQTVVRRALEHALDTNTVHPAYILTGTRGVGKTTLARLLAKALNCVTRPGPSSTPCLTCAICTAVDSGQFVDLIEIDAASRTKVEELRALLENVPYVPLVGRRKVYLMDEVHMLSTHSFNALLKTLEEPPEHVQFILATTEVEKIPETVRSRCVRLHLHPLSVEEIATHLAWVLDQEGVSYALEALRHVATAADGSMRDALSLLEQAVHIGGGAVQSVTQLLGLVPEALEGPLWRALVEEDAGSLWDQARLLITAGVSGLAESLRERVYQASILQYVPNLDPMRRIAYGGDMGAALYLATHVAPSRLQSWYACLLAHRREHFGSTAEAVEMLLLQLHRTQHAPDAALPQAHQYQTLWNALLEELPLAGWARQCAAHCVLVERVDPIWRLQIQPAYLLLRTEGAERQLAEALTQHFGDPVQLEITVAEILPYPTPAAFRLQHAEMQQHALSAALAADPVVQAALALFEGTIVSGDPA